MKGNSLILTLKTFVISSVWTLFQVRPELTGAVYRLDDLSMGIHRWPKLIPAHSIIYMCSHAVGCKGSLTSIKD